MKRSHGIAIGGFALVVLSVAILEVLGNTLLQNPTQHRPLTLEDLNRLAKELPPPEASDTPQPPSGPMATHSPSDAVLAPLPRRLERAVTAEERTEYFQGKKALRAGAKLVSATGAFDAACSLLGHHDMAVFVRGQAMILDGDWPAARDCFTTVLEVTQDPSARSSACIFLAWLEDDPELAARYLEIACNDDANLLTSTLRMAYELAETTGSDALATHYRERYDDFFLTPATP